MKRLMIAILAGLLVAVGALAAKATSSPRPAVERGEYLVKVLGCNDCHTPWIMGEHEPEPDMTRMLSGHPQDVEVPPAPKLDGTWTWAGACTNTAFCGPWGVTYAINLTPDELSGLGIWTEEMFIKTLRTGKHWGQARPIMPPMPWHAYRHLTDEDLKSIWAYLRSIPPVRNRPPDYQPPSGS